MFLALFLAAWQIVGMSLPPVLFATPFRTLQGLYGTVVDGMLLEDFLSTMVLYAQGTSIAIAAGMLIGLFLGFSRTARLALLPYVLIWNSTPRIAFLPLLIVWFGISEASKIALIVLSASIPVIVNTANGLANVDYELIETANAYSATRTQLITKVMVPAALPAIAAGLVIGLLRAFGVAIMAEMFLAMSGLGGRIMRFADLYQTYNLIAYAVICVIIGIALTQAAEKLKARSERYRAQQ
jgi:ABC-type nitrate/sulfonate/bicarbonate transport system permease component